MCHNTKKAKTYIFLIPMILGHNNSSCDTSISISSINFTTRLSKFWCSNMLVTLKYKFSKTIFMCVSSNKTTNRGDPLKVRLHNQDCTCVCSASCFLAEVSREGILQFQTSCHPDYPPWQGKHSQKSTTWSLQLYQSSTSHAQQKFCFH